jgi:hypothetical protein
MSWVTGKNPILVRDPKNGNTYFMSVEGVFEDYQESQDCQYQCFSPIGWVDINSVEKEILSCMVIKVSSDIGTVEIAESCKLYKSNKEPLKVGDKLVTRYPLLYQNIDNGLNSDNAHMAGIMTADGEYSRIQFDIINGSLELAEPFIEGFCSMNVHEKLSNLCSAELFYMYKKASINAKVSDNLVYQPSEPVSEIVKKIEIVSEQYEDFLYNINSDIGTYQLGVGQVFVTNT